MDETQITINERGHGHHYTFRNRASEWDNGEYEASRHNRLIADAIQGNPIDKNRRYVEEIIQKSAEREVKVLLVNLPIFQSSREKNNRASVIHQKEFFHILAEIYECGKL